MFETSTLMTPVKRKSGLSKQLRSASFSGVVIRHTMI